MALFNRRGFDGVAIDDVMAHAGLTHGGFYRHFKAKSELYAEAIALSLAETPWSRWHGVTVDLAAEDLAGQVIRAYLSTRHLDDVDASCPLVALPGDVARSDPTVRQAFESVFRAMVQLFAQGLRRAGRADRGRALAIAGLCVGGMVVARALADPRLAAAVRRSSAKVALALGAWSPAPARAPRRRAALGDGRVRGRASGVS
jgi:AcrR family transcriptional regulator